MDRLTARDPGFAGAVRGAIGGLVRESESLARYSTYRIGGPATVVLPSSAEDVGTAVRMAHEAGIPWFALGLGSNILLPDEGLDALVIRLGKGMDRLDQDGDRWVIGPGLPAPLVARRTAAAGYAGLHIFVGVPGTVGGGVYMNAGCHGGDWSEVVETVTVVDQSGRDAVLPRGTCPSPIGGAGSTEGSWWKPRSGSGPRSSTASTRRSPRCSTGASGARRSTSPAAAACSRIPTGPAGRKRAAPRTAGQLIEAAGLKGFRVGAAEVSPMHANYFVNTGGATAADVRGLIVQVQRRVEQEFGAGLEPEVKVIGSRGEYLTTCHPEHSEGGMSWVMPPSLR